MKICDRTLCNRLSANGIDAFVVPLMALHIAQMQTHRLRLGAGSKVFGVRYISSSSSKSPHAFLPRKFYFRIPLVSGEDYLLKSHKCDFLNIQIIFGMPYFGQFSHFISSLQSFIFLVSQYLQASVSIWSPSAKPRAIQAASGKETEKVVPTPNSDSKSRVPPWPSIKDLDIARPSPVPPALRLSELSS